MWSYTGKPSSCVHQTRSRDTRPGPMDLGLDSSCESGAGSLASSVTRRPSQPPTRPRPCHSTSPLTRGTRLSTSHPHSSRVTGSVPLRCRFRTPVPSSGLHRASRPSPSSNPGTTGEKLVETYTAPWTPCDTNPETRLDDLGPVDSRDLSVPVSRIECPVGRRGPTTGRTPTGRGEVEGVETEGRTIFYHVLQDDPTLRHSRTNFNPSVTKTLLTGPRDRRHPRPLRYSTYGSASQVAPSSGRTK